MRTAVEPIRNGVDTEGRLGTLAAATTDLSLARFRVPAHNRPLDDHMAPDAAEELLRALAAYLTSSTGHVPTAGDLANLRGSRVDEIQVSFRLADSVDDETPSEAVAKVQARFGLTAREAEVLTLVAGHRTNREIAAELVISVRTAEHHVAHILRKLDAPDRRAAVAIVRRLEAPRVVRLALPGGAASARAA